MIFEGIRVFETRLLPTGTGITLPGLGIVLYKGAMSRDLNQRLLKHEFGHILQSRQTGLLKFYFLIGLPSLWSAIKSRWSTHHHGSHPTEVQADQLASAYFNRKLT